MRLTRHPQQKAAAVPLQPVRNGYRRLHARGGLPHGRQTQPRAKCIVPRTAVKAFKHPFPLGKADPRPVIGYAKQQAVPILFQLDFDHAADPLALKANVVVIIVLDAQIELIEQRLYSRCHDPAGDGVDRAIRRRGLLCVLRPLRGQRVHEQWQEKGRVQHQERQQVPRMGLRRGGEHRRALLPGGEEILRAEKGENQERDCHQGAGAQAG